MNCTTQEKRSCDEGPQHPCYCGEGDYDHEWKAVEYDPSVGLCFAGYECINCGAIKEYEGDDLDY